MYIPRTRLPWVGVGVTHRNGRGLLPDSTRRTRGAGASERVAMPSHAIQPVPSSERILALDVLRGWAVFGMLVVNMGYFSQVALDPPAGSDAVAAALVQLLADDKFWTLFSVLFGLGFAMQLDRAAARESRFAPVYMRRLLILLLVGLTHALLHPLEILHRYALLGFLLLPLRRASTRTLVIVGLVSLLAPPVVQGFGELESGDTSVTPESAGQRQADAVRVYSEGSLLELLTYNVRRFQREAADMRVLAPFPYFLLGFYLGRRRLLESLASHLPLIRRVRWWTLGLGIGLQAVVLPVFFLPPDMVPPVARPLFPALLDLGSGILGIFYACVILILVQHAGWNQRLRGLAAVGRLALTNYLLQTALITTLLYGYGAGFYGRLGIVTGLPVALLIFLLQIISSHWWIRRFRFGPVEWLWRSATYGRPQPLRAASSLGAHVG